MAEGALTGHRRGAMVGEEADERGVVAGGAQSHDEAGDVAFEGVDTVLGDQMGEVVEVRVGGGCGGAHVASVSR